MMLYFAYGSNLNVGQMAKRCPAAKPLGQMLLPDWKLVFRGVADCVREPGAKCYGGLWRITDECQRALDVYEGVQSGLYRKEYWRGLKELVLIYCMNSTGIFPPSEDYLRAIEQGYHDFNLPKVARRLLCEAVQASWDDKSPTHIERRRYDRKGRPKLAPPPLLKPGHAGDRDHAGDEQE